MEVLRRCPLAIAQRLVHRAIAVSTAVQGRVTRTMSVALLLRNNPKRKCPIFAAQLYLPAHELFWANLRVQLHLIPHDLAWNPVYKYCIFSAFIHLKEPASTAWRNKYTIFFFFFSFFGNKFCSFSHDFSVVLHFFICPVPPPPPPPMTNYYELKILELCNTSPKVHSTKVKTIGDKKDCNPHAFLPSPVGKNFEFLVFYP